MEKRLDELIAAGNGLINYSEWNKWKTHVQAFLQAALSSSEAIAFDALDRGDSTKWDVYLAGQLGYLSGLLFRLRQPAVAVAAHISAAPVAKYDSVSVFVVHGHDSALKDSVARFLELLKLSPTILHEQPNAGRTLIEKFEAFANVGFAVVLLTPDDQCGGALRARQNVILELGYFMGRLGRRRVCALYREGVELPSDIQGVLYVQVDTPGAWKTRLAQELVEAGYSISLNALLRG